MRKQAQAALLLLLFGCSAESGPGAGQPQSRLTLAELDETAFHPLETQVRFRDSHAALVASADAILILGNGAPLDESAMRVSADAVSATVHLREGRNDLVAYANDAHGELLFAEAVLWAGTHELEVAVAGALGEPLDGVEVTVALGDNQRVHATRTTSGGRARFSNLPDRTILVTARTADNRSATAAAPGVAGTVALVVEGFADASPLANNDFSSGTDGWVIGDAPVQLVAHEASRGALSANDLDLALSTSGEGTQSISRTFVVQPGTKNVAVRYRFVTSEVPGGFFGTKYNDSFSIQLRSAVAGGFRTEANSMNGLGLGAFDLGGRTGWRELEIPVEVAGDTVQVDVAVSNVGDGLLDSQLVIDAVREKKLSIRALALHDLDATPLEHVSLAGHTYFSGRTPVHGTIEITGAEDDALESVELEVLRGGQTVAHAQLGTQASASLLGAFGASGARTISGSMRLFDLSAGDVASLEDGATAVVRAKARSLKGETAVFEYERPDRAPLPLLTRYIGANRFNPRDEAFGGDDWARPAVRAALDHFASGPATFLVNDISNMHGGHFTPHHLHRAGWDVDARYSEHGSMTGGDLASRLIALLDDPVFGRSIQVIFVEAKTGPGGCNGAAAGDPLWAAVRAATLANGSPACSRIRWAAGHTGHFHLVFRSM